MTRRFLFNKGLLAFFATVWVSFCCTQAVAFLHGNNPDIHTRKIELTATMRLAAPPGGGRFAIWVAYPVDDEHQHVRKFYPDPFLRGAIRREAVYGNRMLYYELDSPSTGVPVQINLKWVVERQNISGPTAAKQVDLFRRPIVDGPLLSPIIDIARRETAGTESALDKWNSLYDYVYRTITYSKEGEGWGRGDPVWACTNKRGNCTDFHSLLITLGQTQGLAGRFDMGLPIPANVAAGRIPGYHCWAELYDEAGHWIVVDASEAKKAGRKDEYYGRIPPDRILFSRGRNIVLDPPQKTGPLNFFVDPYVELDGARYDNVVVERSFREL